MRVDILDDIISIAKRATDRLTDKLEQFRGSGKALSIEEEFRLLTLQVIGEAILSLPPEECDRVRNMGCAMSCMSRFGRWQLCLLAYVLDSSLVNPTRRVVCDS